MGYQASVRINGLPASHHLKGHTARRGPAIDIRSLPCLPASLPSLFPPERRSTRDRQDDGEPGYGGQVSQDGACG
jgi:hypothetical protein